MDAVVIGGGIAGLVAANHLADDGWKVTLVERNADLGGRARSDVQDGFVLNQGPHALFAAGELAATLTALDVDVPGTKPPLSTGLVRLDGEWHPIPAGLVGLLRSRLFGVRAKRQVARFLTRPPRTNHDAQMTAAAWIDDGVADPRGAAFIRGLVRLATYTDRLDLLSADVARLQLMRSIRQGVRYLDGGWQSICDGLSSRADRVGVRRERTVAEGITREGNDWIVQTGTSPISSQIVVVAVANPTAASALTGHAFPIAASPSQVAVLDVGLARLPAPERTFALPLDAPDYMSVHSPPAALCASGALVSGMEFHGAEHDGDGARRRLESLLDHMQPHWREHVTLTRYLPRMTVMSAIPAANDGGLHARPDVAVADHPGLFVAGDWVGSRGLLADASAASAVEAARRARAFLTS
jgi:phytoene dehydrogenase-like protein